MTDVLEGLRFGRILVDRGYVTENDLRDALAEQKRCADAGVLMRLGQILLNRRLITRDQLIEVLRLQGHADAETECGACAEPAGRSTALREAIGRFEIVREIDRGSMGVVYEAIDPRLGRAVALKVLEERPGMRSFVERFHREATVAAKLSHPNIIPVHDVGTFPDARGTLFHYICMDLVRGPTLAGAWRAPGTTRRRIVETAETIARAIHVAHAAGVVHRDLKPANILVDGSGRPIITDFGIARDLLRQTRVTVEGGILGTPAYMAPEQFAGPDDRVDGRADLYAIGVILYEGLCGALPFKSESLMLLNEKAGGVDPIPLRARDRTIDPDLETIVMKCLEREPERRYADAAALADDLRRYLDLEPIRARPPGPWYRARKWVSRHRAVAAAAVVVIAAVVAAGGEVMRRSAEAGRREAALQELAGIWNRVLIARQGVHMPYKEPDALRTELDAVERLISDFLARHPRSPQGHLVRARARLYLGRLDDAEADLRRAVDLDASFGQAWTLLGKVLLERYVDRWYSDPSSVPTRKRRHAALLEEARNAIARAGGGTGWDLFRSREDDVTAAVVAALVKTYIEERMEEGRALLVAANELEPSEEYCNWIGIWSPTPEEAERWQTRAIEIAPNAVKPYLDRAFVRGAMDMIERAEADYSRAIEISPDHAGARISRAIARKALGDFDGMLEDMDRTVELAPRFIQGLCNRAMMLIEVGEIERALEDCARAVEVDPTLSWPHLLIGRARVEDGRVDGAIEAYDRAIELDPGDSQAWYSRGVLRERVGDLDRAISDLTRAIELRPGYFAALNHRALAREKARDLQGAIDDLERSLEAAPDQPGAGAMRGMIEKLRAELGAEF